MERLTFEGNFCDIAQCRENPCPYNGNCSRREVWERLKQYEGTGLAPEDCAEYRKFEDEIIASGKTFGRLIELLNADKEGRVVVLPCIRHCKQYGWQNISWDSKYGICAGSHDTREEAEEALRRAEDA